METWDVVKRDVVCWMCDALGASGQGLLLAVLGSGVEAGLARVMRSWGTARLD